MNITVPLASGDVLGTIGEAVVTDEGEVVSVILLPMYEPMMRNRDFFRTHAFDYVVLPEPFVVMRRVPVVPATTIEDLKACVTEETLWSYDHTRFNERTLFKVRESLISCGLSDSGVHHCITDMQNKGILFRERDQG